ncbi:MAG: serine/threonine-protein kinase [Ilumatobacter sp.]|uniref:serine/threonine-protein kinase n=1 Tax=Ilumatobacter sp. TaxID=1967498 RepID=UPI003C75B98E
MPTAIGRYQVRSVLGSGAFATVYLATDPVLDTDVAVKVLDEVHAGDPDLRRRFIDEARTMRQVAGDRLVTIHDIGEAEGQPYLVMSAHRSGTLRNRLADVDGPLADGQILRMIDEIAACLRSLHAHGVVHRDVSPSNLLIDGDSTTRSPDELLGDGERLVLGDFGIARSADRTNVTIGGGTVGYMAPEQGRPTIDVDHRADVFAATQVVDDAVRLASPQTAQRLAAAIERGHAIAPGDRHDSIDEWHDDLSGSLTATQRTSAVPRRRLGLLLVAIALLATVVAVLIPRSADAPGDAPGDTIPAPQIIGPDELLLGDPAEYTHENRAGSTYRWTLPDGETSEQLRVQVTADDLDGFTIELTEDDGRATRSNTLTVTVRSR